MWLWLDQFLHSLPAWGWVLMYAWPTYGGLRWWTGDISGRIKYHDPDGKGMGSFFGILLLFVTLAFAIFSGLITDGNRQFFAEYPRSIAFQMMLVGLAAFLFRSALDFAVPRIAKGLKQASAWCRKTYATMQAKRASSPKRIIKQCRERLAYASRIRKGYTLPTDSDIKSMGNLAQASGNMLALLRDLFVLAKNVDHLLEVVELYETHFRIADAVFDETELKEFAHLVGSRSLDPKSLAKLRHRVQGAIEAIVLRCLELPTHAEVVSVDRQIEEIVGFQKYVGQDLVDMTEARDAVTDFETGRLHKRILAELDLDTGVSLTGPHTETATTAPRARVKA